MTKTSFKIVVALCVCIMMLSVCAFADQTIFEPDSTSGKYTVTYNGAKDQMYVILVIDGHAEKTSDLKISESSIMYIDQVTAGTDGIATFSGFLPRDTFSGKGTVCIGGTDLKGPVIAGYIGTLSAEEGVVSGTVKSDTAQSFNVTVTLTDTTDAAKVFTVTTSTGTYSITVPFSTYTMNMSATSHVPYTKNNLTVNEDVTYKEVVLKAGDTDGNQSIGLSDITGLLSDYGKSSDFSGLNDIDGDGSVGLSDLTAIIKNFGQNPIEE